MDRIENPALSDLPTSRKPRGYYAPFGNNLVGIEKRGLPDNKLHYINREKQSELGLNWYDLEARFYDRQLDRFWVIDPLIELDQESWTPYHYSFNNPIRYSDPDGRWPGDQIGAIGDFFNGALNVVASNATTFESPRGQAPSLTDKQEEWHLE